ncbi:MAG: GH116 family glycosyl hydrolase [Patescibacteria group bacterium]|nr:GH116 family glycosyl hydrolase [Patescibacteria group bacterium]
MEKLADNGRSLRLIRAMSSGRGSELKPLKLSLEDNVLLSEFAFQSEKLLAHNYSPGFGIFPSADSDDNFYNQLWSRDFAHAAANYFIAGKPEAVEDSLKTIFSHQKTDGAIPLKVEREYMLLKLAPGLRWLAKPLFVFMENVIRGRKERPVYKGQDFLNAEDTIPAVIIAVGEFFIVSAKGREFAEINFTKLQKAINYFECKVDKGDGLASFESKNVDWADSVKRGGKLGGINILWARALRLMSFISFQIGKKRDAEIYGEKFRETRNSILEKLYNREGAYFRTEQKSNRIDAAASIFGSLYLLNAEECVRVQKTFNDKLKTVSGLRNFYPSYPKDRLMKLLKIIGNQEYHNFYIWPWLTFQNIQVKIKIALGHSDELVRSRYKKEAIADLLGEVKLFKEAGGAYEIFYPSSRRPAVRTLYKPPKNFMGNLVSYLGAYQRIKELHWI